MTIALLDAHDVNYDYIGAISDPNRVEYCNRHNIDFIRYRFDKLEPEGRQPNWGRFQGLITHLPNYDWIFYLDTDAIITNMDIDIRDCIDESYDMIAGPLPHEGHLSTGGFLIKNSQWSMDFMADLWSQTQFIDNAYFGTLSGGDGKYFEQSSFHYLYDTKEDYRKHIKVVERKAFASTLFDHQPDHLLVHLPGRAHKLLMMCAYLKKDYAIVKRLYDLEKEVDLIYRRSYNVKKTKLIGKQFLGKRR